MAQSMTPLLCWTWHSPSAGFLATRFEPDGDVVEGRQELTETSMEFTKLGKIPVAEFEALVEQARQLPWPSEPPVPWLALPPKDPEWVEAWIKESGAERTLRVSVTDLPQTPALAAFRAKVIEARKKAAKRLFVINSPAFRIGVVFFTLSLFFLYLNVKGSRKALALNASQHLEAVVVQRVGSSQNDKGRHLRVRLTPKGEDSQEMDVSEYLSDDNWTAAKAGDHVAVCYDAATGVICLERDLSRYLKDQNWLYLGPVGFAGLGLLLCLVFKGKTSQVRSDGTEYVTREDRVVLEGRNWDVLGLCDSATVPLDTLTGVALRNQGVLYEKGQGVAKDLAKANDLYRQAFDKGDAIAGRYWALNLENGVGVEPDPAEANRIYLKAGDMGDALSLVNFGFNLQNGIGAEKDPQRANEYYWRAGGMGSGMAFRNLGANYENGIGAAADPAEANRFYLKAGELGDAAGYYNLGLNHENGVGCNADTFKAREFYHKAAEMGHEKAQVRLASLAVAPK